MKKGRFDQAPIGRGKKNFLKIRGRFDLAPIGRGKKKIFILTQQW